MSKVEKRTFTTHIHLACAKANDLRPVFEYVHFINGYAYASDGYILIKSSMKEYFNIEGLELLNGHALHAEVYKLVMGFKIAEATTEGLECLTKSNQRVFIPYPNLELLGIKVPSFEKVAGECELKSTNMLGITPRYMRVIDRALVHDIGDCIRCLLQGDREAIIADVPNRPNQMALLMPCVID